MKEANNSIASSPKLAAAVTRTKVILETIELHVFPNDYLKFNLLQSIKQDTPIFIPFMI